MEKKGGQFLKGKQCGYVVIEASAGLGKTAFLAHLVKKRGWMHHFVELAPGINGIIPARKNLVAQILRAHEMADSIDAMLPDEAASRPDYLGNMLRRAAMKRRAAEKIVLVVDGLDEAGTYEGENVLGRPKVQPQGVFFVLAKRRLR